jgi:hypothetical protein
MTVFSSSPRLPPPPQVEGTGGTFADTTSFPRLPYRHVPQRLASLVDGPSVRDLSTLQPSTKFRVLRAQVLGIDRMQRAVVNDVAGPDYAYSTLLPHRPTSQRGTFAQSQRSHPAHSTVDRIGPVFNPDDMDAARRDKDHDSISASFKSSTIETSRGSSLLPACLKTTRNAPHCYAAPDPWTSSSFHRNSPRIANSRTSPRNSPRNTAPALDL